MPYVCDDSKLRWIDGKNQPPKVSDFIYMPAQEVGGPFGPAKLRIPSDGGSPDDDLEDPELARALHLALKASGFAKVYCRYDGGNDEGFAWIDHAELTTGERIAIPALAARPIANGLPVPKQRLPWQRDWPDEHIVQEMLDFPLAVNWAAALLGGRGFGTGEYWMYGAFVVDLVAETITDDATATPIVRNVRIEGIEREPPRVDPAEVMRSYEAAVASGQVQSRYKVGDRIIHRAFGGGTVADVHGDRLMIDFDSGGRKIVLDGFVERE